MMLYTFIQCLFITTLGCFVLAIFNGFDDETNRSEYEWLQLKYQLREPIADHVPPNRSPRAATARIERLWDYAVIPYEIESNFSGMYSSLHVYSPFPFTFFMFEFTY